jgi:hypothetical protein
MVGICIDPHQMLPKIVVFEDTDRRIRKTGAKKTDPLEKQLKNLTIST